MLVGQRQALRFSVPQVPQAVDEINVDGAHFPQLLQFGLSAQCLKRSLRRTLQVRGAPFEVFLKQTQRRLAVRDAVFQCRDVQARRVGIETAQPQHGGSDVFGGQVLHLGAKSPPELEVLRLDPVDGPGNLGRDLARFSDLALQPCGISGRRGGGERQDQPERQSATPYAPAGTAPCRSSPHARRRQPMQGSKGHPWHPSASPFVRPARPCVDLPASVALPTPPVQYFT